MQQWQWYQNKRYLIETRGNGLTIAISRYVDSEEPGGASVLTTTFFAQCEDATEYVELYEEHGAEELLRFLDGAGVDL